MYGIAQFLNLGAVIRFFPLLEYKVCHLVKSIKYLI